MTTRDLHRLIAEFESQLLADIPLTRAMQLRVTDWDGERLRMTAPLAPNVNDKGCAFGGSLASLMTLAGWGLIVLRLRECSLQAEVYVQDSTIRYLAPLWTDFSTQAQLADGESWEAFFATLRERGRARLRVVCAIALADGREAVGFEARFVAIAASRPA